MSESSGDYAGMSNDKIGENPIRRKPKVSWGRQIRPGLAGTLVEAEKRRRWTAGQHSCAGDVFDAGTASRKAAVRIEMSVANAEVIGIKPPVASQGKARERLSSRSVWKDVQEKPLG